jgi:hypothetical protein
MALTKVTSGLISADASSVDLNIDAGTLYIDATNNKVGVGNSSPNSYSASANNLVVGSSGDTGITIVSSTVSNGQLKFADGTTGDATGRGIIDYNHASDHMALKTAATERMRIGPTNGYVSVGGTNTYGYRMQVEADTAAMIIDSLDTTVDSNNYLLQMQFRGDSDASGAYFILFSDSLGTIGSITCASTSSVSFNTTSDYRLKENVVDYTQALDTVLNLRPVKFNYINSSVDSIGFIAHEAEEHIPSIVVGDKDDVYSDDHETHAGQIKPQGIDYGKLTPILVKAIQEQQTLIEELKTRIETLENS